MSSIFSVKDKRILITGGASGIGSAIFLASDALRYVTGTDLYVDGV